jgi:hypothetical protein
MKKKSTEFLAYILIFIVAFYVVLSTSSPIFFAINDDGIIANIANGRYSGTPSSDLIFGSKTYGFILSFLYGLFPIVQWHGIYIYVSVFLSCVYLLKELVYSKSERSTLFARFGIIILIFNVYLFFLIYPTYTISSLITGFTGVIIFYRNILTRSPKYMVPAIFLLNSFIIRPDGYLVIIYFLIPGTMYIFIKYRKREKVLDRNLLIFTPTIIIYLLEQIFKLYSIAQYQEWNDYWNFHNAFSAVTTNPSMLKMHGAIAGFQISGIKWTNVEATLLHYVVFIDPTIFTSEQMQRAMNHVKDYIGISGLINAEISMTFARIWEFMSPVSLIFIALIIVLSVNIILNKTKFYAYIFIFFTLYVGFLYYYLAAVLRIPPRINVPIIFMIIIGVLFLSLYVKFTSEKVSIVLILLVGIIVTSFQFQPAGFSGVKSKLLVKQRELIEIDAELNRINPNGIFIGDIKYGIESYTDVFSNDYRGKTLDLTSGWHVFSPPWFTKVRSLGVLDGNPVPLLPYRENTYWVSGDYIGEVMAMYLNDRRYFWQGKCQVGSLPNAGLVFSYQISDKDCQNKS